MKIKRLPLFVIPLLLIVTNTQAQTPSRPESPPWQTYTVGGEDFSFAAPVLPSLHATKEFREGIKKYRRTYSMGAYADGIVYVVLVFENPKPRQSLESFIQERGISTSELTDVTLNGFRGKAHSSQYSMSQYFATEDRLYDFGALSVLPNDPRITKFLSSFSLKKKKDSVEVTDGPGLPYGEPAESMIADDATRRIFTGKEVDRKARLVMKIEPSYTETARQNAVAGTVVLKCVFSSNGSVTNIRTVSGLPYGLTEKAIDAARKIKFMPAIKNGKFVSMWMQLEYNFNLY